MQLHPNQNLSLMSHYFIRLICVSFVHDQCCFKEDEYINTFREI